MIVYYNDNDDDDDGVYATDSVSTCICLCTVATNVVGSMRCMMLYHACIIARSH